MDYSFDWNFGFSGDVFICLAIYFICMIFKNKEIAKLKMENRVLRDAMDEPSDEVKNGQPQINILGAKNFYISGLWYDGKRMPEIEIRSKTLYLDGKVKRLLATSSRVYNRGAGIFVDGKYVG